MKRKQWAWQTKAAPNHQYRYAFTNRCDCENALAPDKKSHGVFSDCKQSWLGVQKHEPESSVWSYERKVYTNWNCELSVEGTVLVKMFFQWSRERFGVVVLESWMALFSTENQIKTIFWKNISLDKPRILF